MIFKITADAEIEAKNIDEALYKIGRYYLEMSMDGMPAESIFINGEIEVKECEV